MALSERVQISPNGFKLWPSEENDRTAYFGIFTLKDDPAAVPELREAVYWDLKNSFENGPLPQDCFVYIEERKNGQVVEVHRFYHGGRKASLSWEIAPARRAYGKTAHMITLQWNGRSEAIHRAYIFLTDRQGNRYPFITKTIGTPGEMEDKYIFILPDGETADGYKLGFDPLLLQKYNISVI